MDTVRVARLFRLLGNVRLVVVSTLAAATLGCRAPAAPDAGFLDQPKLLHKDERIPFHGAWIKTGADLLSYKKVYVAPIDTTHLLKLDWWQRASLEPGTPQMWADELAGYFQEKMKGEFSDDDENRYQLVESPDDETLIIELALVEVVPTKVWLNSIGYVALGPLDQGSTAFEGRFRDGKSKEVVAEFKDREYGQFDLVSVADLQWAAHSRHTIRIWTSDLEEICYLAPGHVIAPMSTVTLRPW